MQLVEQSTFQQKVTSVCHANILLTQESHLKLLHTHFKLCLTVYHVLFLFVFYLHCCDIIIMHKVFSHNPIKQELFF